MVRLKQQKPSPSQVRPIFDLPIFTGCHDAEHPGEPGSLVFHSSLYYLPMLYTYFGARRNEMAGLRIEDVLSTDNGPAIHIRANELRRVKNAQSDRLLPVPDEVIRLGFLDYAQALARLGYVYLFPELYAPHHKTNDPGDRFYKDFMPILRASPTISETLWDRTIHALRHGFSDTLKQAGVDSAVISDIAGRLGQTETELRYTNPAGLPLLRSVLAKYPAVTSHLEPQPIRLLPWVVAKAAPPWAGRKAEDRFPTR